MEPTGKKGEKGEGFDVLKSGDARVAMIGFPSVGKVNYFGRLCHLYKTEGLQIIPIKIQPVLNARVVLSFFYPTVQLRS